VFPIIETGILGRVNAILLTRLTIAVFSGDNYAFTVARPVKGEGTTTLSTKSSSFSFLPICTFDEFKVSAYDIVIVVVRCTRADPPS
jgi:hypothetical protein